MKRHIHCAATLDSMKQVIEDRLSVSGVKKVEVYNINSKYASVRILYDDGTVSRSFHVRFENHPDRSAAQTAWTPGWSVLDDGTVVDANGRRVGYFKLIQKRPQSTSPNYLEDSLVVDYGTQTLPLNEESGRQVADAVRNYYR